MTLIEHREQIYLSPHRDKYGQPLLVSNADAFQVARMPDGRLQLFIAGKFYYLAPADALRLAGNIERILE